MGEWESKYLSCIEKQEGPTSSRVKVQTRISYRQTRTTWRDMNCTLGTTQGVRHSKNAQNAEDNQLGRYGTLHKRPRIPKSGANLASVTV